MTGGGAAPNDESVRAEPDVAAGGFVFRGLRTELAMAAEKLGFSEPTPVQAAVIPALLGSRRDCLVRADTGSGKTAAYGMPLLNAVSNTGVKTPQALVLCPTRELCIQVAESLREFAAYMTNVRIFAVYGGADQQYQAVELRRGVTVIAATPGRLCDMLDREAADLSSVRCVVLDEADEMLRRGFADQLSEIMKETPQKAATWMFSATFPRAVSAAADRWLENPMRFDIPGEHAIQREVSHICFVVPSDFARMRVLRRILSDTPDCYGIVFARTRERAHKIASALGMNAAALSGDMEQTERNRVMRKFRRREIRVVAATDVAARGLDLDRLTHIIHYDMPDRADVYTHRTGRTGRRGHAGMSVILAGVEEIGRVKALAKRLGIRIRIKPFRPSKKQD